MANDARKQAFTREVIRNMQTMAPIMDGLDELDGEYFDQGYNGAGADPIIDADVAAYSITAAQFTNVITLMQQLQNFFANTAVTTGDYAATVNAVRRSPGV